MILLVLKTNVARTERSLLTSGSWHSRGRRMREEETE